MSKPSQKKSFGIGSHIIAGLFLFPAILVACIWRNADMPWFAWLFLSGFILLFLLQMSKVIIYPDRICRIYYFFWRRNQTIYFNEIMNIRMANGYESEAVRIGLMKRGRFLIIEDKNKKSIRIFSNYIDRFEELVDEVEMRFQKPD